MITARLIPYLAGGLVIVILLAWALRLDTLRAGYKQDLADTITRYEQAQKDAQADFDRKIADAKSRNERLNDEADKKADAVSIVYRDRVVRLPAAPAGCAAQGSGLPKTDDAKGPDGPGSDAVLLARSDVNICAVNQARLEAAHEWALEMEGK